MQSRQLHYLTNLFPPRTVKSTKLVEIQSISTWLKRAQLQQEWNWISESVPSSLEHNLSSYRNESSLSQTCSLVMASLNPDPLFVSLLKVADLHSILSGPCQFPTLGFVVDQYERVQAFIPEPFWHIHVGIVRDESTTSFSWRRGRIYDQPVAQVLFDMCEAQPTATVLSQQTKPTQKW
jgi:hypothetical protein